MLPLLACTAGVSLGLYFQNALILLPVSLVWSGIWVFATLPPGLGFSAKIGDLLVGITSLQAGYLAGLICRNAFFNILARFRTVESD